MKSQPVAVFWFRRDLRLHDNAALEAALKSGLKVLPVFILDKDILSKLKNKADARVEFIHNTLFEISEKLNAFGSALYVAHGDPLAVYRELVDEFQIRKVFFNRDYEPYATERDAAVEKFLDTKGIETVSKKDQVIFEKNEVQKSAGGPYTVFTPYSKKWKEQLKPAHLENFDSIGLSKNFLKWKGAKFPTLESLGFRKSGIQIPTADLNPKLLKAYKQTRDFPAENGTSHLGIHLRFGTVSIRDAVRVAKKYSEVFLNELIWREFFMQILFQFPHVVGEPFRPEYAAIRWLNDKDQFQAWCEGRTGYPIVDAGMRELNETGFMHNRVRMIAGSFLVKHLLVDWRWGEAYFSEKLLDFELASNNGNWQWVAGTGCDAAPYFRVFNPSTQAEKFDPKLEYVRKWVPEFESEKYPKPIVDHKTARERAIKEYKRALGEARSQ